MGLDVNVVLDRNIVVSGGNTFSVQWGIGYSESDTENFQVTYHSTEEWWSNRSWTVPKRVEKARRVRGDEDEEAVWTLEGIPKGFGETVNVKARRPFKVPDSSR